MASWSAWIAEHSVRQWIADKCLTGKTCRGTAAELYAAFVSESEELRAKVSMHAFGRALRLLGYESGHVGASKVWFGIELKRAADKNIL